MTVSRETSPSVPPEARGVFPSDRLQLAARYADWLSDAGTVRGLIGPREVPRLWTRHLLNCAVITEVIPQGATVADLGSGAGLPGLVVAIARPDLAVTLVEPLLRRTNFLAEVTEDLALENVKIFRGRAEALHGNRRFDVVTSRALAPLGRLAGWSMPLVAPTAAMVALKGESAVEEVAVAEVGLRAAGCGPVEVLQLGSGVVSPPTTVVRLVWADSAEVDSRDAGRHGGRRRRSAR